MIRAREWALVFAAAVLLYLPTLRYGFVQDDRAIIVSSPAAHSVGAALRAFDDPYWPRESGAGLYRPLAILTYAIDWILSGGRPSWFHFMNALWHGLATALLAMVLARWLPSLAAAGAALVFAWHPVHVEAVASLVGRAELLAACGILAAVLAARRGWWTAAVLCATLAMFSKEHGVIAGVVILLDKWLQGTDGRRYPAGLWIGLILATVGYFVVWGLIGIAGMSAPAAVFFGRDTWGRLAIALPAVLRAAILLVWPVSLSSDYSPRVIPAYTGVSLAAILGCVIVIAVPALVVACRRRAPAVAFAAAVAALSFLPTSNLLFAGGIVLAERNLYLAVALPAAIVGTAFAWLAHSSPLSGRARPERSEGDPRRDQRVGLVRAVAIAALVALACGSLTWARMPAWRDNRAQLLTLLVEHPESYLGHASAAAVLAGRGDTAGARHQYRVADSLFPEDPYLDAAHAIFLLGVGDTAGAQPLIARIRARSTGATSRMALRARFLFDWRRGDAQAARAVADSARQRFPRDEIWYRQYLQ